MDQEQQRTAKLRLIIGMREGRPWREAAAAADLRTSRTAAYRLLQRVNAEGEQALVDGRHGHPSKLREPVRAWLGDSCRGHRIPRAGWCRRRSGSGSGSPSASAT